VRAGDPIGLVGNSGSSSQPQLHVMVTDGPQPIASNGRPWVLSSWRFAGRVANLAGFNNGQPARILPAPPPAVRRDQLPLQGALVSFTQP
jgi:murein DD-endopeptidase MepM/ murein hydrolase activator NlpD